MSDWILILYQTSRLTPKFLGLSHWLFYIQLCIYMRRAEMAWISCKWRSMQKHKQHTPFLAKPSVWSLPLVIAVILKSYIVNECREIILSTGCLHLQLPLYTHWFINRWWGHSMMQMPVWYQKEKLNKGCLWVWSGCSEEAACCISAWSAAHALPPSNQLLLGNLLPWPDLS